MTYNFRKNEIILLGDTHSLETTRDILKSREVIEGNDIWHCGDAALGFGYDSYNIRNTLTWLGMYNQICKDLDIRLYINRGNHDATYPEIWDSTWCNVTMIKTGDVATFPNGKTALLVGGGISVDRVTRKNNFDYWTGEGTPILEDVPKCDIVFSHDCPEKFNHPTATLPNHYGWYVDRDPTLLTDCANQRKIMTDIVDRSEAKTLFYGHFHNSMAQKIDGVYARCLDINELFFFDAEKEYTV